MIPRPGTLPRSGIARPSGRAVAFGDVPGRGMSRAPRSFFLIAIPLALGVALLGLKFREAQAARTLIALPSYGRVPAFEGIDQDGQRVSSESLNGSIWIADFIFTRCAGQCPMMTSRMAQVVEAVREDERVQFVSFTVDPSWDTPSVLSQYARTQGVSRPSWRFVTGDAAMLARLCREGFRLSLAEGPGTTEEPITHSTRFVLVDRQGVIRGYYDATDEIQFQQLRRDLHRLLQAGS